MHTKIKNRNPLQPIERDEHGTIRFKKNQIVSDLSDAGSLRGFDMNYIVGRNKYSQTDLEQFAQLIGYSISGFHELPYVSDETALEASAVAKIAVDYDAAGCRDRGCSIYSGVEKE